MAMMAGVTNCWNQVNKLLLPWKCRLEGMSTSEPRRERTIFTLACPFKINADIDSLDHVL